uniref:Uncharacterized protein n=1 Tax=Knipowitschia caucasica TaxID=637954 RepID=A0AAV2KT83_KNICA
MGGGGGGGGDNGDMGEGGIGVEGGEGVGRERVGCGEVKGVGGEGGGGGGGWAEMLGVYEGEDGGGYGVKRGWWCRGMGNGWMMREKGGRV